MKFLVQIASDASVSVENQVVGSIPFGYMVLIGVEDADTKEIADKIYNKNLKQLIDSAGSVPSHLT